ncbi:hypothetical protein KCH_19670 [Kitasatospora cheerisanensis KCTC 2395]|uniref:Uncharacterized protein n=1 Tax=Kitasatospora cheerisanensis KCTC 2395 TaxID=1348663 RepID=A0A066Z7K0_9ACTN|nr:hypothetical protein KCH_19670 [Kitasatospora cheerisanensis KCTC 2395]
MTAAFPVSPRSASGRGGGSRCYRWVDPVARWPQDRGSNLRPRKDP